MLVQSGIHASYCFRILRYCCTGRSAGCAVQFVGQMLWVRCFGSHVVADVALLCFALPCLDLPCFAWLCLALLRVALLGLAWLRFASSLGFAWLGLALPCLASPCCPLLPLVVLCRAVLCFSFWLPNRYLHRRDDVVGLSLDIFRQDDGDGKENCIAETDKEAIKANLVRLMCRSPPEVQRQVRRGRPYRVFFVLPALGTRS